MNKKILVIFAALTLLLTPVLAGASTTHNIFEACWDEFNFFVPGSGNIPADSQSEDPGVFGVALLSGDPSSIITQASNFFGILNLQTSILPQGTIPTLVLKMNNFPNPDGYKDIFISARFSDNYRFGVGTTIPGAESFTVGPADPDGRFVIQTLEIRIRPNPEFEEIFIPLIGQCFFELDWLCVRTDCVQTPIPGSLLLLGTGVLGLVGIGIRRKSA